ncbi:mitochondrial inner membrane protease ATP23 homolog [Planococcus citri]|uniref:mitochondrial inner membrane protease ATP23 homolog n=1 Tax=Planococcus citri TaxID=170843 RepID=UPI0031F9796D
MADEKKYPIQEFTPEQTKQWGYDLFPQRRGDNNTKVKFNPGNVIFNYLPTSRGHRRRCEENVYQSFKKSPVLKILVSALERNGCPVDFSRHISCEHCDPTVTGGYDPIQNQIVVCQNMCTGQPTVHMVLFHELIHMYDNCVAEIDFQNIEHLACTEIRAANLTYCNYLSAFMNGFIVRSTIKGAQRECVKKRAIDSVIAVRPVTLEEAEAAVNKVFKKCYNDTEPIGRRLRPRGRDEDLAYSEAFLLGYD